MPRSWNEGRRKSCPALKCGDGRRRADSFVAMESSTMDKSGRESRVGLLAGARPGAEEGSAAGSRRDGGSTERRLHGEDGEEEE